ncbi:type 1 glutamine amidotransferase [Pseudomonas sp. PS02288]|uniref:type 1 glutamine amidotransferase n=1 Tax=Pseudomonas sp. PS02288 TaxID=2991443 RepID=UPI00249AEB14|nr:type 1 glutamine amidotransferase [Pseudomonas sp. PS02288]
MSDILILTHADFCSPGHLAETLDAQGLAFDVLRVDQGELDGYDLDRPRAVAVMGGPMSVNDPLPWLVTEDVALRHFIERDIPLIGHCLGGQLLAKTLGARVMRMPYSEIGWQTLRRCDGERASPWLDGLADSVEVFQWHGDTFELPAGAQRLFASDWCGNQGFAWGDKVLGLQGHPEMTEELVRLWVGDWGHLLDSRQPSQQSGAQMLENLSARVGALNRVADVFYRHWLKLALRETV